MKLWITWVGGQQVECSGTIIGVRTVLTAGHCVYNRDASEGGLGYPVQIEIVPSMNDTYWPRGFALNYGLPYTTNQWIDIGNAEYDWGIIGTDRPFPLGAGGANLCALSDSDFSYGIAQAMDGYPCDTPAWGNTPGTNTLDVRLAALPFLSTGSDFASYDSSYFKNYVSAWKCESGSGDRISNAWCGGSASAMTGVWHGWEGDTVSGLSTWVRVTSDRMTNWGSLMTANNSQPTVAPIASPWQYMGGGLTSPVTVLDMYSAQWLFGRGTTGHVYYNTMSSTGSWSPIWTEVPGSGVVGLQKIAGVSGPSTIDLFARGPASVDVVWWNHYNGFTWTGWRSTGGALVDSVTAVTIDPGYIVVMGRGPAGDMKTTTCTTAVSSCTGWTSLGGNIVGDIPVTAVSRGSGSVDAFVIGPTGVAFWNHLQSAAWSGYQSVGSNTLRHAPAVVSWGSNRIDLFSHASGDGIGKAVVLHNAYDGMYWTGWSPQGGLSSRQIAAASPGFNNLAYTIWGPTGQAFLQTWNGTSWLPSSSGYYNEGGNFAEAPSITYGTPGQLRAFGRAWDGAVWWRTL